MGKYLLPLLFLLLVSACSPLVGASADPAAGPTPDLPTETPFQPALIEASPTAALPLPTDPPAPPTATSAPVVIPEVTPAAANRGPCDNVFYPLVPGTQWVYLMRDYGGETRTMQLNVSQSGDTQARIDVLDRTGGASSQAVADCLNGAILNMPLMTFGPLFGYVTGEMNTSHVSGTFMPAEADFAAADWNMSWSGEYVANGVVHGECNGQPATVLLTDSPFSMSWQTAGQETITVPAGTFEGAYKFNYQAVADGTLEGGAGFQARLTVTAVQWYVPYVGLLRNEVVSATLNAGGLTLPVIVNGSGELVEFRPGP